MITRRESILGLSVLVALLAATAWSCMQFVSQRDAAFDAERSTASCRALATAIKTAPPDGANASLDADPSTFSSALISAAEQAGIPSGSITQIDPQPIRLINDSTYEIHPIHLSLRDMSLRQVITFLHALPYTADELHLSASSDTGDTFSVELTVNFVTRASHT